jgi:hypothetical protein
LWFDYLRQGQADMAFHLKVPPQSRWPLDERLWEFYRDSPRKAEELRAFVQQPAVRALLALGDKAQVRYYDTLAHGQDEDDDWVQLVYAVTYDDDGVTTTFFVSVLVARVPLEDGRANWRYIGIQGGVRPPGW